MEEEGYTYEVVYEDVQGVTYTEKFTSREAAEVKYDSLPGDRYKAQWQVHRRPYIEQLMRVNSGTREGPNP